jgi:hypothetical protein
MLPLSILEVVAKETDYQEIKIRVITRNEINSIN